jgi:hypothetical protein
MSTESTNIPVDSDESPAVSKTVSADEDATHALVTENSSLKANNSQMTRKEQTGKKDAISQLVSLEERKLQYFRQLHERKEKSSTHEDENYHFLMDLLPHLRDVRKRRKLAVRLKLQQVLMEEETEGSLRIGLSSRTSHSSFIAPTPSPHTQCSIPRMDTQTTVNTQTLLNRQRKH